MRKEEEAAHTSGCFCIFSRSLLRMSKEVEMPTAFTWMLLYFLQELTAHVQCRRGACSTGLDAAVPSPGAYCA